VKDQTKNAGLIATIIIVIAILFFASNGSSQLKSIPISELASRVNKNEVSKIVERGETLEITLKGQDKPKYQSRKSTDVSLLEQGVNTKAKGLEYSIEEEKSSTLEVLGMLTPFISIAIIIGFFWFMMRQAQGQGNQAMSFGKSRARIYGEDKKKVEFKDIAGNLEAKEDLEEVVEFLKQPKKFRDLGAKIPKGVLLVGAPGTGKTMLARAVAGEAKVPFFSISGSEFVEMFVGVGASRVRDLFSKAKKNSPCIIFIDEIDAVGRRRGSGMGGGHDEREQTLNQILTEMDGFEGDTNVIVLAATNRADVLDPALMRPGRFDRRVQISLPDRKDREAILKVHYKDKPIDKSVDLDALAAKTAGSSGADLANIANESAIIAARRNRKTISNAEVTEAFEKVAIGPERKNKIMNEKEKEMTAYHEAGHALVGHVLPLSDPIHKVTIISRGGTGGVTWAIPPEDKNYHSINEYKDVLARILGGRIAEKVMYGPENVTTGAGSDLKKASELAREMVTEQGMGKRLRNMVFNGDQNSGLMFDRMVHDRPYSEDTAKVIDVEVEELIQEAAARAEEVIKANKPSLKKLADRLLEVEPLMLRKLPRFYRLALCPAVLRLVNKTPKIPLVFCTTNRYSKLKSLLRAY
jgi:cell division protease FtsH